MRELVVDNFAGGGGASTGIEMATGRSVDIAINHDPHAIAMHTTNHPNTLHYCESVLDIDPVAATAGMPVRLAWFSPDCRHFSKAKGTKPVLKEIRGLAWISLRWCLKAPPQLFILENVKEFQTWGPLIGDEGNQRPDLGRAGETYRAFISMLTTGIDSTHPAFLEACEYLAISPLSDDARRLVKGLGYVVETRELVACDYGAPTTRKRFFLIARCDGDEIRWPEITHGDPKLPAVKNGQLLPWKTAADCIDWSVPCNSIFGRKKDLAHNTMKRIAHGIKRFVVDNPSPFIVKCNHTTSKGTYDFFRGQSLYSPLQTITKKHGYALARPMLAPIITKFRTGAIGQCCTEPMPTITAGSSSRPGGNGHALGLAEAKLVPFIGRQFGRSIGHDINEPSAAITAGGGGKSLLVSSTLIQIGYGEREGQAPRVPGIDKPLGAVVAGGVKHALVTANLVKHYGGNYSGAGTGVDGPIHTITVTDHHALVTSNLVVLRNSCFGQACTEPTPTVTSGGLHLGEVRSMLIASDEFASEYPNAANVRAFLDEHFGEKCSEYVTIDGVLYVIVDIGMRMLQPHELYRAQGFPEWYVIDRDYAGKRYAKDKQVARCGNAVPPQFAEALVRANMPEICTKIREVA